MRDLDQRSQDVMRNIDQCVHSMKSIQGRAHSGIPMSVMLPVRLPIIRLSTDPPPIC
ncbi:hypothetical protein E2C01_092691 [Portunus trituberculatus]|uniref:Uncharacterized protein n=1 Tax=Portunus trituberculatus TaxID=210409 RepID=A0A5B7JWK3_PORTR|nr:hypothetical protein [Portunus trituberculatus]